MRYLILVMLIIIISDGIGEESIYYLYRGTVEEVNTGSKNIINKNDTVYYLIENTNKTCNGDESKRCKDAKLHSSLYLVDIINNENLISMYPEKVWGMFKDIPSIGYLVLKMDINNGSLLDYGTEIIVTENIENGYNIKSKVKLYEKGNRNIIFDVYTKLTKQTTSVKYVNRDISEIVYKLNKFRLDGRKR